jgi:hypothetical protein
MKFMSILLREGRKEDLMKKYESKFSDEGLSNVFADQFIKKTNFKYADFILKNLNSNYSFRELEEVIEALQKFDKIQNNLEKKDINTYKGFFDLISTINEYTKDKEKPKSKKIYEDDKFVVVEPQNFTASCKYGSKTRWCTTNKNNDDYFNRYTSGNQGLYYVISKKNMDENLYKIAIHISNQGEETFYDAADSTLSNREMVFFKNAFPEMWKTIKKYHDDAHPDETLDRIKKSLSTNDVFTERLILADTIILNTINGFELVEHNGNNFIVHSNLKIYEKKESNQNLLDEYLILITANFVKTDRMRGLEVKYHFGELGSEIKIDLGFDGFSGSFNFIVNQTTNIDSTMATHILNSVKRTLENNSIILKYIHKTPTWRPNRFDYGYTFERKNKGLIKKLVDWLDEGKIGAKLDFLVDIDKLERKTTDNGNPVYKIKGTNHAWRTSSDLRGHFSSFFASAKLAGILNYRKVGNQYLMIKGPNFDAFKNGELKAL